MQIGLVVPLIGDLPHNTTYSLEETYVLKKVRNSVVARSSAEVEYRSIALATCELVWIKQLLQKLKFYENEKIKMAALHIASNPVFLERTKHIEINCHFVREKLLSKDLITEFVSSNEQLASQTF